MYIPSQIKLEISKFTEDMVILQVTVRHGFLTELYASRERKKWSYFTLIKQSKFLYPIFKRKYFCP